MRYVLALIPLLILSCANTAEKCDDTGDCGAYEPPEGSGGSNNNGGSPNGGTPNMGGEGGSAGTVETGGSGAGGGGGGTTCDATSPDEDACVITNDHGVFVSPDGSDDDGDGTQSAPFATLGKAIETAAADDKHVYACATGGAYTEALRLDSEAAGVALFGGFDCDTWAYDTSNHARIAPSDPHAVVADGADGLTLHDLEIVASDATESGQSSIALSLLDTDATLTRVTLTAGQGAAGTDGTLTMFTYADIADLAGCDATDGDGDCAPINGGARTQTCEGGGTTTGGGRGVPTANGGAGLPLGTANGGELSGTCGNGGKGDDGADGTDGTGAQSHGTLTNAGWTPANGTDGSPGAVGQGGGGGSGGPSSGMGGGGGCGGCGGAGATAGQGGGSSIALLSVSSAVTLAECALAADDAGHGGDAEDGQRGQYNPNEETFAGFGGDESGAGCNGGPGGLGGDGGASGGGAGGLSVGILHDGTAPTLDDVTSGAITTGDAGDGGTAVSGQDDTAGVDGVAADTLQV